MFLSMSTLLTIFVFFFLLWFYKYLRKQCRIYQLLKEIPGPNIWKSLKILWIVLYKQSPKKDSVGTRISKHLRGLCDTYGHKTGIVKFWNGVLSPYIFVCEAKLSKVKQLITQNKFLIKH